MKHSDNIEEIAKALTSVQGELKGAEKSGYNPFTKSKYMTLANGWDAARLLLSKAGLSIVQGCTATKSDPVHVIVDTMILHTSGQWITTEVELIPKTADPQGVGSAITYGRRYGFFAALGLTAEEEDDDGNRATRGSTTTQVAAYSPKVQSIPANLPPFDDSTDEVQNCSLCSKLITGGVDAEGKLFTAKQVIKITEKVNGKPLCYPCYKEAKEASNIVSAVLKEKKK
jgi:hypothetical protein